MFFQLLFIHLFRPFLKYKQATSPLPAHVSPRKFLIHAASMISKLLRLYKRTHGLRQICNIVVYISHSACTIHLLNLPDKNAARDIVHSLKHLEEIGESWLCARRTLKILHVVAKRWSIDLPDEADKTFVRADAKFGPFDDHEGSPKSVHNIPPPTPIRPLPPPITAAPPTDANTKAQPEHSVPDSTNGFFASTAPLPSPMPKPDMPMLDGHLSLPPRSAAELVAQPQHQQQQYAFPQSRAQVQAQAPASASASAPAPAMAPTQQQTWINQDHAPREKVAQQQQQTSPTMLFGGVDSLVQDQEWWLRDSNQMFANWNGMEQDAMMQANNPGFDTGTGNMGFDRSSTYAINGMNGMNGMTGMTGMNGMNDINGINGNAGFG